MALSRSMKNLMHDSAQARRGLSKPQPRAGGMSGMISQAMQQARARQAPRRDTVAGQEAPSGMMGRALQQAKAKQTGTRYNPGPKLQPRGPAGGPRGPVKPTPGGGRWGTPAGPGGPVLRPSPGRTPMTGSPRGPAGQQALIKAKMTQARQRGGTGGVVGPAVEPRKPGGTFGFAARGGGGTPALQQATAGARSQAQGMRDRLTPRPTGLPGAISGAQQRASMATARAAGPAALAQPRGQSVASRIGGRQGPPARRGGMARALGSGGSRRRMLR